MTYAHLGPLGSHPLLDPLWSSEDVELVHDGCEATRLDKLALRGVGGRGAPLAAGVLGEP